MYIFLSIISYGQDVKIDTNRICPQRIFHLIYNKVVRVIERLQINNYRDSKRGHVTST